MSVVQVPTGSQLLGELVRAFQLHDVADHRLRKVVGKRGQRLFAEGRQVRNPCGPICLLGWVLVGTPTCRCGHEPAIPQVFEPVLLPRPHPLAGLFVMSAHVHALAWDRFARPAVAERPELLRAFVRFGTLDLAMKTVQFRIHEGLSAPVPGTLPAWAEAVRRGEPISQLLDASPHALGSTAKHAGFSVDAFKRWRRGERCPTGTNLKCLVKAVLPEDARASAQAELSRHYALAALADKISRSFGAPFLRELALVFNAVVGCQMAAFAAGPEALGPILERFEPFMLAFSSWLLPSEVFMRVSEHHAPGWASDVDRATQIWRRPLADSFPKRVDDLLGWVRELHDGR